MTTNRVVHDKNNPYTLLNTSIVFDKTVSGLGKALWLYAFSRPDDWQFYTKEMVKHFSEGVDAVATALKTLERAGYLERSQSRLANGRMGPVSWVWHEVSKKKVPEPDKPVPVEPEPVNPRLPIIDSLESIEKNNNTPPDEEPASPGCCSSSIAKLIGTLPLTDKEAGQIAIDYARIPDADFEAAIKAYKQYAARTSVESHVAAIRKALKEGWTPNTNRKVKAAEEARKAQELEDKHHAIGYHLANRVRFQGATMRHHGQYLEIKLDQWPIQQTFRYADATFPQQIDNVLMKLGTSLAQVAKSSGK